jgi:hypothetical protein
VGRWCDVALRGGTASKEDLVTQQQIEEDLELKRHGLATLARRRAEAAHALTAMVVDSLLSVEQARTGSELRLAAENCRIRTELAIRTLFEVMSYGSQLTGVGSGREALEAFVQHERLPL